MQHVIKFTGKISWDGRANGLPEEIYAFVIFDGDDSKQINNIIEAQGTAFVRSQAMYVQRDQGQVIDIRQIPQDRILVPMCWIVSIAVTVTPLVGELSLGDEDGVERLKDGSEPPKQ
jgi:hypothetical protein